MNSPAARAALAALLGLALLLPLSCGDAGGGGFDIVFQSNRDGDLDIYAMSEDGSGVRQLVDEDGRDFEPDVSPDGATIVYASQAEGSDDTRLYLMDLDGGNRRRLGSSTAEEGAVISDDYPHWSPDGATVVFQRTTATEELVDADLWLIDVRTGVETRLTDSPEAWDSTPSFAADGQSVVFESNRDGEGTDIYRLDVRSGAVTRLTAEPGNDLEAKESPDGLHIVFASERDGDYEVYVMDADGGNVRRLTDNDTVDRCPHWSADGTRLSFYSERDGDREIYVMGSDGSDQRRVTRSAGNDEVPAWVPD